MARDPDGDRPAIGGGVLQLKPDARNKVRQSWRLEMDMPDHRCGIETAGVIENDARFCGGPVRDDDGGYRGRTRCEKRTS
jgi:hypothetical protein